MKYILLIISLLALASCKTSCLDKSKPSDEKDCFKRATQYSDNYCCAVKFSNDLQCREFDKKWTEEQMKRVEPTAISIKCFSKFLSSEIFLLGIIFLLF